MRPLASPRILALLVLSSIALLVAKARLDGTLLELDFATGWVLLAGVVAVALRFWTPPSADRTSVERRVRGQLALAVVLLAVLGLHMDLELPVGWIESVLFALVAAWTVSTALGVRLATDTSLDDGPRARWIRRHVPLTWSLLGLAVFHGAFVHLHGALAHLFLYAE